MQFEIKYNKQKANEYNDPDKIVRNLLGSLEKYDFRDDLLDLEIQAFNWDCLKLVNNINPNIRTSYLLDINLLDIENLNISKDISQNISKIKLEEILKIIANNNGYIFGPEESMVTKDLVDLAKNYDLDVIPWFSSSFNSSCDMSAHMYQKTRAKELGKCGVRGVISDWF